MEFLTNGVVDASDPMVAVAAVVMVNIAKKCSEKHPKVERFVRSYAPTLAVLSAVMFRAVMEVASGHQPAATEEYVQLILRGLGSGAMAVLAHSQMREMFKRVSTDLEDGEFMNEEDVEAEEVPKP